MRYERAERVVLRFALVTLVLPAVLAIIAVPEVESVAVLDVRSLGVPGSWGIASGLTERRSSSARRPGYRCAPTAR